MRVKTEAEIDNSIFAGAPKVRTDGTEWYGYAVEAEDGVDDGDRSRGVLIFFPGLSLSDFSESF